MFVMQAAAALARWRVQIAKYVIKTRNSEYDATRDSDKQKNSLWLQRTNELLVFQYSLIEKAIR